MEEGNEFASLSELERAIKQYEEANYTNLRKFHTRTIESGRRKGVKRYVNPQLEYLEIDYRCIRSGEYQTKSKGLRPNQGTFRSGCPVVIKIRPSKDGNKLFVKELRTHHNHDTSQAIYNHLPRQRRLDTEARDMATKLVKLKINKKLLQNDLMQSTGKVVTLKDIHNLNSASKDDLREIVNRYKENRNITLKFIEDENGTVKGIYFQDTEMKRVFSYYPEMLFVDAIYKVNDRRMPLYVFLIEDGNGETEIVGLCLLTSEEHENVLNMVKLFKKLNPDCNKTKTIMSDKDVSKRMAFKSEFPAANLLICIFDCLRSMFRQVTTEKMNITRAERETCLRIFQRMVYSKNEDEYMACYEDLNNRNLEKVIGYFNKNWHPIRNEWIVRFQRNGITLGNSTNNRLETLNQKITQVISRFSRLDQLFEGLEHLLNTLRTERDKTAVYMFSKTDSRFKNLDEDSKNYYKLLTPYAFDVVLKQIELMHTVSSLSKKEDNTAVVQTSSGEVTVSAMSCQCSFVSRFLLPCRHIFAYRAMHKMLLYSADLCSQRWKKEYYKIYCRVIPSENSATTLKNEIVLEHDTQALTTPAMEKKVLSYEERFRISKKITDELASLLAEATGKHFEERKKQLLHLKQAWMCTDANFSPQPGEENDCSFQNEIVNKENENNLIKNVVYRPPKTSDQCLIKEEIDDNCKSLFVDEINDFEVDQCIVQQNSNWEVVENVTFGEVILNNQEPTTEDMNTNNQNNGDLNTRILSLRPKIHKRGPSVCQKNKQKTMPRSIYCIICGNSRSETRALHSFPRNLRRSRQWQEVMDIPFPRNSFRHKICSLHFTPESYTHPESKMLNKNAVPSIWPIAQQKNLSVVDYLSFEQCLRASVETYKCEDCEFETLYLVEFKKHKGHSEVEVKNYVCNRCNFKTCSRLVLMKHECPKLNLLS